MKIEKFLGEKVELDKFPMASEKFSEMGNLKQREMHHCLRGMDAHDQLSDMSCTHWR